MTSDSTKSKDLKAALACYGVGVVLLVAAPSILYYNWSIFEQVANGPRHLSKEELLALTDVDSLSSPWISFDYDQAAPTDVVIKKGFQVIAKFYVLRVGDRLLVAKVRPDFAPGTTLTGLARRWTDYTHVGALNDIHQQLREVSDRILPFQCDAEFDFANQHYGLAGVCGGMAFIGLFLFGLGVYFTLFELPQRPDQPDQPPE